MIRLLSVLALAALASLPARADSYWEVEAARANEPEDRPTRAMPNSSIATAA